jgi:Acyl-CoA dehydrogenase, C-terminal domain
VHVSLTDEQTLLVETVADMVARGGVPAPRAGEAIPTDTGLWEALVESGLVGMRSVDGASAVEVALVTERLARGPVAAPYAGTALALELLTAAGASGEVGALVESGRSAAVVLTPDLARPGGVAGGLAWDALPGGAAVALEGDGVVLATAGTPIDAVDLTRLVTTVDEDGTPAGISLAADARTRWHAFALAILSADLVGAMAASLEEVVEHAKSRVQFGRPVGSFQAVQHLCADALVLVESSRSVMWHASWAGDALDPDDALEAARVAKAYCAESARDVCETAIQVWGGIGMTWECRAHLFLRRALLARRTLGDETVQLARLAERRVGAGVETGSGTPA